MSGYWPRVDVRTMALSCGGSSPCRFLLPGSRNATRPGLGLGLWQESEACLTPREVNTHVDEGVRTPAWAGEVHDRDNAVGLSGLEGHRPSRDMVWSGIDAQNQVAR